MVGTFHVLFRYSIAHASHHSLKELGLGFENAEVPTNPRHPASWHTTRLDTPILGFWQALYNCIDSYPKAFKEKRHVDVIEAAANARRGHEIPDVCKLWYLGLLWSNGDFPFIWCLIFGLGDRI